MHDFKILTTNTSKQILLLELTFGLKTWAKSSSPWSNCLGKF